MKYIDSHCFVPIQIVFVYVNVNVWTLQLILQDLQVRADHLVVVTLARPLWRLVKVAMVMACRQVEMVLARQLVMRERLVPILVEVPAVGPQVLCPAQLRSSVRCAKSGLRIRILSSVPPSPITNFASLAPGIVSRGRGLDQRLVVACLHYVAWMV